MNRECYFLTGERHSIVTRRSVSDDKTGNSNEKSKSSLITY